MEKAVEGSRKRSLYAFERVVAEATPPSLRLFGMSNGKHNRPMGSGRDHRTRGISAYKPTKIQGIQTQSHLHRESVCDVVSNVFYLQFHVFHIAIRHFRLKETRCKLFQSACPSRGIGKLLEFFRMRRPVSPVFFSKNSVSFTESQSERGTHLVNNGNDFVNLDTMDQIFEHVSRSTNYASNYCLRVEDLFRVFRLFLTFSFCSVVRHVSIERGCQSTKKREGRKRRRKLRIYPTIQTFPPG